MLYKYHALTPEGEKKLGSIEAGSLEIAINSLQRRNLIIVSINPAEKTEFFILRRIKFFERVKFRDVVILSRQLSTLFEAKVPILESLKLLANENQESLLGDTLSKITKDIQGGISLSQAFGNHPNVFSKFYINMVKAGEESGKLSEIFSYLADYLEHSYELASKAKNALFYPAFVITTFIAVMILMFTMVIPRLTLILKETAQELPIHTKIVIGISQFMLDFGVFILIALSGGVVFLWQYIKTTSGKEMISRIQISLPIMGNIYKKIYISRISDSLATLLSSGIPVVRSLDITADIVGNATYKRILNESSEAVKAGSSISDVFSKYKEMPPLVIQMIKIGEQGGKLNFILKTLSNFYRKEVDNVLENLVSLIEPILIVVLGLGVGFLLIAVLGPIYSLTGSF